LSRSYRTRRRRSSRRTKPRSKILLALGVLFALGGLGVLSAVGYVVSIAASAPPLDSLKPRDPGGFSLVLDRDGHKLGVIQARDLRKEIPAGQIPESLKDATVAIEDARFYKHRGVDYVGVIRAAIKNLESGKQVQGGSTITMQLVRTLYGSQEKSYKRKIREAKLAEELEDEHSKEWILTKYLNTVPYGTYGGQTALGVWAASKTYFNKPPSKINLAQAALLAGLPQAPSEYSPIRDPGAAKARRNEVLDAMAKQGMISDLQAAEAKASPLQLDMSKYFQKRREGYFFDYVKDQLYQAFPAREVRRGGLRVYTTIDPAKQEEARNAIAGRLAGVGPSSAIVTINPANGQILTMASSSDYGSSKFNLAAQGHRQPGSAFKVMALMTALRRGVDPDTTTYVSHTLNLDDPTYGHIDTHTFEGTSCGCSETIRQATLHSDNTIYMQMALDLGPENVKQTAYDMGITTHLDGYPAETLGGLTIGVSPLEMADAYATIASGGVWHKPISIRKIVTADGTVLKGKTLPKKLRPEAERRFQDGVTAEATQILEQNMTSGTGRAAQTGCPAGGKTGTTSDFSDGWFVGFTPRLSTAVWVGYPDAAVHMYTEYHGGAVSGPTFPAEIWGDYTKQAMGGFCGPFPPPQHPMTFTRFYGRYAGSGRSSTDTSTSTSTSTGTTTTPAPTDTTTTDTGAGTAPTDTTGTGGSGYDPDLYESPPQEAPTP
jgi:penicillin-binding protein 1A